jgi:hypothetical protein
VSEAGGLWCLGVGLLVLMVFFSFTWLRIRVVC